LGKLNKKGDAQGREAMGEEAERRWERRQRGGKNKYEK
jgi:hypothetical protein